jgi:hypothetical protein
MGTSRGGNLVRLLRGLIALPFWLLGVLGMACMALAKGLLGLGAADPVPESNAEAIQSCSDWTEYGLVGFGLLQKELAARGLECDPEVVETRLDIKRRSVTVRLRPMLPDETASDVWRAHCAQAFSLTPKLQADLAARDNVRRLQEQRRTLEG